MPKQIVLAEDARQELSAGVEVVARAVRSTLGPKGRNVALAKKYSAPTITHDGVSVANEIDLDEVFQDVGAQLIKEAASRTGDSAGDGTTTATVLAQAVLTEALKSMAAGANAMILRRGIDKAIKAVMADLARQATPIQHRDEIAHIAAIASGDDQIGELIAQAMDNVGRDGAITVDESKGLETEIKHTEGMTFDKGYASPQFITDRDRMEAVIEDPYILVTNSKPTHIHDLVPLLDELNQAGKKEFVVISDELAGDPLAVLLVNNQRGNLNSLGVNAPGYGDRRKDMMEDLAILVGATAFGPDAGRKLEDATIDDLGQARRVIARKDETIIEDGKGRPAAIQARVKQIKATIDETTSKYDLDQLEERLARLAGGVAVVHVGAATEVELKEKKARVEDALAATRAALAMGVVPGGGVALLNSAGALDEVERETSGDEQTGVRALRMALEQPVRQLAVNSGLPPGVVINNIRRGQQEHQNPNYGLNVLTGEYGDLVADGVIDPARVTRSALQNGVSIANLILTTEVVVAETGFVPEGPPGGAGGGMGGMDPMGGMGGMGGHGWHGRTGRHGWHGLLGAHAPAEELSTAGFAVV